MKECVSKSLNILFILSILQINKSGKFKVISTRLNLQKRSLYLSALNVKCGHINSLKLNDIRTLSLTQDSPQEVDSLDIVWGLNVSRDLILECNNRCSKLLLRLGSWPLESRHKPSPFFLPSQCSRRV